MKPETKVWMLCESVGKPESTLKLNTTLREAIKAQAEWLLGVYMGAKIRITFARNEEDLQIGRDRRSAKMSDIMDDLESVLGDSIELETE